MNDPRSLTTLPDILSSLSALQSEEAELSSSLSQLLSHREPIIASLAHLHSLLPQFDQLQTDANILASTVSTTAKTAEWVGGRVRSLDEEMRRVREATDRVGQVMELKSSLLALQSSIEMKDWEAAARHCARAMALPLDVIAGPFAEAVVPTAESHLPPVQTLQDAREILLKVFRENFAEASRARDSSATSRFFKLFPAIGWEDEGLEAYANFVVELVQVRSPPTAKSSSPLYYITALTALFESIALIVDQHQPVVEKYYGPGKMKSVVGRLLEESDRVTKSLSNGWEEDRSMQRKLSEVTNNPPIPLFSSSSYPRRPPEDLSIDPREIDKVLSELAGMVGRWNLFKKFILDALKEDVEKPKDEGDENEIPPTTAGVSQSDKQILDNTASHKLFEQLMSAYYIPMEVWYTRTIIDKAHRLSTPNLSQAPVTTTTPDDVFYILKSVFTRLITTGSPTGVEKTIQQLREAIDRDYIGIIKHKLDDVYKTQPQMASHSRPDRIERENRTSFIILLNDLDVSMSHLEQLIHELVENSLIVTYFIEEEQTFVKNQFSSLSSLTTRMKSALRSGVEQLFNQLLRPKLRTFIPDVYKDISYVLDEDGYSAADFQDLARKRFIKAWDLLIEGYKDTFSEANYRLFIGFVLDVLLRPWEKYVMGLKYTELGAVRFDRDLRAIITYLSSQTTFGDIREKFLRLQQISTLLNLDADEDIDEFYNGSGISWKIGRHEARAIAALKI
ncbi:COG4 transport protein-domain-containing protein [Gymnopilus junonius]|uniref:Conserved oligomeric Golgi complex subunit 4 n=1 Tax=Gymnopilus junonius TaxID=109634 RepID=A0A9P5NTK0_GYMJU|nr:COG4 transport protein-domain-containing protein [Gymnopilus junonius]